MTELEKPHARRISWVIRRRGNEGKTWLQNYIESLYGYERVALLDIDGRGSDLLHALRKRPLALTDIFLINIPKSTEDVDNCYNVFEAIKDGCAVSTKYDSYRIRFKTPNTLIVFSNDPPNPNLLSQDRWFISQITKDDRLSVVSPKKIRFNKRWNKFIITEEEIKWHYHQ